MEFRDALCVLDEASSGEDEKKREWAAVYAAAAVGLLMSLAANAAAVADNENETHSSTAQENTSMFALLFNGSKVPNTNTQSQTTPSRGSIVDIQARRILGLEAALEAERDAQISITRQYVFVPFPHRKIVTICPDICTTSRKTTEMLLIVLCDQCHRLLALLKLLVMCHER